MNIKLKKDHGLFQRLKKSPPQWWNNLKSDNDIYIDVRKDNYLNAYHNGGSIMKLEGATKYRAHIHFEYMPLQKDKEYLPFNFKNDNISFLKYEPIELNNFSKEPLEKIKKRIRKFYPNDSEKGIQGNYVVRNNYSSEKTNGFFIDTEFQYADCRIDLVWVDLETQKIAFVELKTMGDERLYVDKKQEHKSKASDTIDVQLGKYCEFVSNNKDDLLKYYNKVYCIKNELGLLPEFVKEQSLVDYELIKKPILLVGHCSQEWINNNADELNKNIKDVAFGSLYQGKNTYNFRIPYKSAQNRFRLSEV